jgi:CrcB protein
MTVGDWVIAAGAGGLATFARFRLDGFVSRRAGRAFPFGTLAVNLSGAFVLGLLVGLALDGTAETLLGTATVGSYTTFSTWLLETHRLGEEGELRGLYLNVSLSLVAGVGAAALGRVLGRAL